MNTALIPGARAPDFDLETTAGRRTLNDYAGSFLVLYFYPRDNTPGCTLEAREFSLLVPEFAKLGAEILGVSRDTLASHEKFAISCNLGLTLGSDADGAVSEAYGTWEEKKMYGRTSMGVARRTFLIGPKQRIVHVWNKVRPEGHAAEVLALLQDQAVR